MKKKQKALVQCCCCFDDVKLKHTIRCSWDHVTCKGCIKNYFSETLYGALCSEMKCTFGECGTSFLSSELEKVLKPNELNKYYNKLQQIEFHKAGVNDILSCVRCGFVAQLPKDFKVFICPDPLCRKEFCRNCKKDWKNHIGLKCSEVESTSLITIRTKYEERLTEVAVRKCGTCQREIIKESGCNLMTCLCGAKMCYKCRKAIANYSHFCPHPKDPLGKCSHCTKCLQFEETTTIDAVAAAQVESDASVALENLKRGIDKGHLDHVVTKENQIELKDRLHQCYTMFLIEERENKLNDRSKKKYVKKREGLLKERLEKVFKDFLKEKDIK